MNKELQKKFLDEAQQEWGKGAVQKRRLDDSHQELLEMAEAPFARTVDDPKLERNRKEKIRDGDPMAEFVSANKPKHREDRSSNKRTSYSSKPKYSGPKPTPNRFGIMPGYRWDAVDRGNGIERKILLKISEKTAFNEDKYKWAVADM